MKRQGVGPWSVGGDDIADQIGQSLTAQSQNMDLQGFPLVAGAAGACRVAAPLQPDPASAMAQQMRPIPWHQPDLAMLGVISPHHRQAAAGAGIGMVLQPGLDIAIQRRAVIQGDGGEQPGRQPLQQALPQPSGKGAGHAEGPKDDAAGEQLIGLESGLDRLKHGRSFRPNRNARDEETRPRQWGPSGANYEEANRRVSPIAQLSR